MTDAQTLVAQIKAGDAAGWAGRSRAKTSSRLTDGLDRLADSTIGDSAGRSIAIRVYRCADGSRLGVAKDGTGDVWAFPAVEVAA